MQRLRNPSRRSFLAQVAGGGLLLGAGLIMGATAGRAQQTRQMVIDADPRDPARPPPPPPRPRTDSDSGPRSDAGGRGQQGQTAPSAPLDRFVVCPGHPRCPG